jgi:hypothetical protein
MAPSFINGTTVNDFAPYTLAITTIAGFPGIIDLASVRALGNIVRYAVVDYSGFDGDLSFNFYF